MTDGINNFIKTFVILDLETTGLPQLEHNRTKITEISLIAVQADHLKCLKKGSFPRIKQKLTLCFYPNKRVSLEAEELTGLNNFLLEPLPTFNTNSVNLIMNFLNHLVKPICLVAHNGLYFDFPILLAEMRNASESFTFGEDIYCVDSLEAFIGIMSTQSEDNSNFCPQKCDTNKILDIQRRNEKTPKRQQSTDSSQPDFESTNKRIKPCSFQKRPQFISGYKLAEIYEKLYPGHQNSTNHLAESDTETLLKCLIAMYPEFNTWANKNLKLLNNVSPMVIGRRIGF